MSELVVLNAELKLKILQYQSEYLEKKGLVVPDNTDTKRKMRKAVDARLKEEIKELNRIHKEQIKKLFEFRNPWID